MFALEIVDGPQSGIMAPAIFIGSGEAPFMKSVQEI